MEELMFLVLFTCCYLILVFGVADQGGNRFKDFLKNIFNKK